ncbi:MAG: hypothetical protein Fur002_16570 [Anaerolineales bacterium]
MKKWILLFAVVLSACQPAASDAPQQVQPPVILPPAPTDSAYIAPSYPTAQVSVAAPNQSFSGMDVRMESVTMDGKNLNALVCFTLPDSSDWGILSARLNYGGGIVLQEFSTMLVSIQEPTTGGAGLRCDTLTFLVPPDADLTNAVIVIESIGATPRADDYCSIYMPKIQQALLERGAGIMLQCVDVNGAQAMQIVSFPPEMTQQQAEELVYSPEFYSIQGNWEFSFQLSQ